MNLLTGVLYHVWRCTTGRPQFVHMADTRLTLVLLQLAFAITTLASALARRPSIGGLLMGVGEWLFWMIYLPIFFSRKDRSQVLLAACFAGLAGSNVITAAFQLATESGAGLTSAWDLACGGLRFLLLARILDVFTGMPAYIQRRGYALNETHESRL